MSDIIRNETAHAINGVAGRLFTLRRPPAPWKTGTFANQTWISESRPVAGYGTGGEMRVTARFDDNYKNGHNDFAITAEISTNASRRRRDVDSCGCLHGEIAKHFPELAHLIRWHLCSTDGPMYYIANTVYHAKENGPTHAWVYFTGASDPLQLGETKERLIGYLKADEARASEGQPGYRLKWADDTSKARNLAHARSTAVWPDATDEQLCAPVDVLTQALQARLPALLAEMRADIEAAGFMWECPAA